jgi:3-oxoacyl-[acyl-carrier-protein] synthase-3
MATTYGGVYVNSLGAFLPGPPVPNEEIDRYIQPLNRQSERIKGRILKENGIRRRHYAIDEEGRTRYSAAQMAARAARACLDNAGLTLEDVSLLCTGSSGADLVLPGFASMVQGEMTGKPMETASLQGVCSAGLSALQYACLAVDHGAHERALVDTSELPSRLFKRTRFAARGYNADFDSHFLRWMLSDGAGAFLVSHAPNREGLSLKVKWIHLKSFGGDFPVCMQVGYPEKNQPTSYLDYASFAEAEEAGAFFLRQDIRLLPHLFDVGLHEYAALVERKLIDPTAISHFLCHYSSEKFAPVVRDLLDKLDLSIPSERWYSNLTERGNTGAASIFIMLEEFARTRSLALGEQILCFVPESGRFTVGFMLLEVVEAARDAEPERFRPAPPHRPDDDAPPVVATALRQLAEVWHDYRSRAHRTPLVQKILKGELTRDEYVRWMSCWIPQVREGSGWMRAAAARFEEPFLALRTLVESHAHDEHLDYTMLFEDYQAAGGTAASIDDLRRNAGGEALHAFMISRASRPSALDLLGAMYIIEGTGSQIIPLLLPRLKRQLGLPERAFRFLEYHGANDTSHLDRWLQAVIFALEKDPALLPRLVETARITARLYVLQMEEVL